MTLHIDTPARFADLRDRDLCRPDGPGVWGWLFLYVMLAMVAGIVLIGWLAFSEITRCDPCEWVQFDAPMEGW